MPLRDPLDPYETSARRTWYIYILLIFGAAFFSLPFAIDPAIHCVEYPCPDWLFWIAQGMGALFAVGALSALIYDTRWGSSIDLDKRTLTWWRSGPPGFSKEIPIDEISVITIDRDSDSNRLILLDTAGKRIHISDDCIPGPWEKWAQAMQEKFPHIKLNG